MFDHSIPKSNIKPIIRMKPKLWLLTLLLNYIKIIVILKWQLCIQM